MDIVSFIDIVNHKFMKKYFYILLGMMIASLQMSEVWAGDGYQSVFFNDFGGNQTEDDVFGPDFDESPFVTLFKEGNMEFPFVFVDSPLFGYSVLKHWDANSGDWYLGGDHTNPSDRDRGYFLFFNPGNSSVREAAYRTKLPGLCRGVNFQFTAYMANLSRPTAGGAANEIRLSLGVYEGPEPTSALVSEKAYLDYSLPVSSNSNNDVCLDWQKMQLQFTLNNDIDAAYFIVTMEGPQSFGWDFAIDDINIEVWKPEVTIKHDSIFFQQPLKMSTVFNNNGFFSDMNEVECLWEFSKDGVNYSTLKTVKYTEDQDFSYMIDQFDRRVNNGYYRVTIGRSGYMDSKVCTLTSEFQINEKTDKKKITLCENKSATEDGKTFDPAIFNDGDMTANADSSIFYYISKKLAKRDTLDREYTRVGREYIGKYEDYKGTVFDREDSIPVQRIVYDQNGCLDSIISWTIVVTKPTIVERDSFNICQGQSAYGMVYNTPGHVDTVVPENDFISYAITGYVHPTYRNTDTVRLCQDAEFNGKYYHEKGGPFYVTDTFKTKACGCDSIVGYTIFVEGKTFTKLDPVTICYGESFEFYGKTYSTPGVYNLEQSFSTTDGCDSVVTQRLEIKDKIENRDNPIDTLICYNSKLFGKIYPDPTPQNQPILVQDPTVYTSANGCDSIVWYSLTVLQIQLKLEIKSDRNVVCDGEEVEIYIKELIPNNVPYTWYPDLGGANSSKKNFTPTGDMDCVVKAERVIDATSTCVTTDTIHVYVREAPVLSIDSVNQKENVVGYSVTGGEGPYQIILDKKEIGSDESGEIHDSPIGSHKLVVMDKNECEDAGYFEISPIPVIPATYFTPNNDGVNDTWLIENVDVYPRCNVKIYDRFGRIVYDHNAYDNEAGFDGTYAGNPLPASDYWYVINLPESDRQLMGHFTLIR